MNYGKATIIDRQNMTVVEFRLPGRSAGGSAPAWGAGGRRFKSSRPDQKDYGIIPLALGGRLIGRTADSGSAGGGSSPPLPAKSWVARSHPIVLRKGDVNEDRIRYG